MAEPFERTDGSGRPAADEPRPPSSTAALAPGSARDPALPPGARVAGYTIDSVLARGEFAIVYRATDRLLRRHVALKEYFPQTFHERADDGRIVPRTPDDEVVTAAGRQAFIDEARLLAHLQIPGLLSVIGLVDANDTLYRVMPYAPGRTLADWRHAYSDAIEETALRRLLLDLLEPLEQLHAANLVHGYLLPEQVMVAEGRRALLLGFGTVRRALHGALDPTYAPIEQLPTGSHLPRGAWSDLYSLAALARFAAGLQPAEPGAARRRSSRGRSRIGPVLAATLQQALLAQPSLRPQTVAAFRAALARTAAEAPPPMAAADAQMPLPGGALAAAAAGGIDFVLPDLASALTRRSRDEPPDDGDEAPARMHRDDHRQSFAILPPLQQAVPPPPPGRYAYPPAWPLPGAAPVRGENDREPDSEVERENHRETDNDIDEPLDAQAASRMEVERDGSDSDGDDGFELRLPDAEPAGRRLAAPSRPPPVLDEELPDPLAGPHRAPTHRPTDAGLDARSAAATADGDAINPPLPLAPLADALDPSIVRARALATGPLLTRPATTAPTADADADADNEAFGDLLDERALGSVRPGAAAAAVPAAADTWVDEARGDDARVEVAPRSRVGRWLILLLLVAAAVAGYLWLDMPGLRKPAATTPAAAAGLQPSQPRPALAARLSRTATWLVPLSLSSNSWVASSSLVSVA